MKQYIIYGILCISGVCFVKEMYSSVSTWTAYPQPQWNRTTLTLMNGIFENARNSSSKVSFIGTEEVTQPKNEIKYQRNAYLFHKSSSDVWHIGTEELTQPKNDIKYKRNAYLNKECYKYSNVTAINTCCKMHQYTTGDFLFCAAKATKRKERFSIVFIGDSRIRQIFNSFGYLLRNTKMTYTYEKRIRQIFNSFGYLFRNTKMTFTYEKNHGSVKHVLQRLMKEQPHTNITFTSKDLPLDIYFHWDPYLNNSLPELLKHWLQNPGTQPNLLYIESGTHHLVDNGNKAFGIFEQTWRDLLPSLSTLAETTHTVVKMVDHVLVKGGLRKPDFAWLTSFVQSKAKTSQLSDENINHINSILPSLLDKHSNNILVWDSNIKLADLYIQQCYRNRRSTYDLMWCCKDDIHIGYIVIHQLRNMILNSYCNQYLNLGNKYCK